MRFKSLAIVSSALVSMTFLAHQAAADTKLSALFMSQAAYSDDDVKAMTAAFEKANPGITVTLEFVPYENLHDKIIAAAGAGDRGYDVVLFDQIWPSEFDKKGILVDVSSRIPKEDSDKVFAGAWTTTDVDGKRLGMPWILDTKYLFYNKAMLAKAGIANPPKTWAELETDAEAIKAKGIVQYPVVWSWSQAEAVICDFTTLAAAYGGTFFKDGKPAFNAGGTLQALDYMKTSLDKGVTNPSSREYLEEDVRKVFSNGEAAFALNWTYMYAMAKDPKQSKVADQVGVVPAPGVDGVSTASAVNGSMGLGITSNSAHPDEAWKFISYLTSPDVQNKYAKLSLPIWKASYTDKAVTDGQEDLVAAANTSIGILYSRPALASYTELSDILQKGVHKALLGEASPQDALNEAADKAARLR